MLSLHFVILLCFHILDFTKYKHCSDPDLFHFEPLNDLCWVEYSPSPKKIIKNLPSNYKLNIISGEYKFFHYVYFQRYFTIPSIIVLQVADIFWVMEG